MQKSYDIRERKVLKTVYTTYHVVMDTVDNDLLLINVRPSEIWDDDLIVTIPLFNNKYMISYKDLVTNLYVTVETIDKYAQLEKVTVINNTISDCEHCADPESKISYCPTCPRLPACGTCR